MSDSLEPGKLDPSLQGLVEVRGFFYLQSIFDLSCRFLMQPINVYSDSSIQPIYTMHLSVCLFVFVLL